MFFSCCGTIKPRSNKPEAGLHSMGATFFYLLVAQNTGLRTADLAHRKYRIGAQKEPFGRTIVQDQVCISRKSCYS